MRYILKKSCFLMAFCSAMILSSSVYAEKVVLDLDTVVNMALKNNSKTKIADGNLKSAEGTKKQTIGSFGPLVSFSHTSSRSHSYDVSSLGTRADVMNNFKNSTSVTYPLYTGGKREGSVRAARRNLEIAELEIGRVDQEVKLDATNAYYTLLQTRNLVVLNEESVIRLKEHLKNVQAQYNVGVVAKVDVLRSEVELADAEQSLIKAKNDYDVAKINLNNTIGLSLDTETEVNEELTYNEYAKGINDCLSFSEVHRAEILQAEKSIDAAKGSVISARSGYLPTVNLNAGYGWDKDKFPGDQKDSWQVSATLNFTIFDSNTTRGAVDAAQGSLMQKEATYKQTKDNVFLEVSSNYLGLRESEKRISTAHVAVEKAQEDYKIEQARYQAGVGTNTDLLDSQVALRTAQTNYVQALYDYNTSWAKLENSMGVPVVVQDEKVVKTSPDIFTENK